MKKFDTKRQLILYFMKGSVRFFVMSAVFAAMVSLLDMLRPRVISFTVDSVIGTEAPDLPAFVLHLIDRLGGMEDLRSHLILLAAAVLIIGLLAALFRYLFRSSNARGAELFVERIRNELFRHIMYLPYSWMAENSTGDIIQRCTSDVQTIKRFIAEQLTALVRTIILIVMAIAFMGSIHWKIMLISTAFIPIIVAYSLFFHTRIGSAFEKADIEEGRLSTIAQENLTGVRVVRAFGREMYERERFEKQNVYYTNFWVHLIRLLSAFWSSGDILTGTQMLSVLIAGSFFCVNGELTAGEFIALLSYNVMLTWPVRVLGRVISEMSKAGISIDRLRYIMNSGTEQDAPDAQMPPMDREICFDHVSFTYENGTEQVLRDVSLSIAPGSTVGILGGTGSGKSTLMYLLERMYDLPEGSGRITIGGVDIREIPRQYLRRNIGIVLQEPFLFSRTLEENIGFALDRSTLEEVRKAARIAAVDDTIQSFSDGYQTFVGERGMTLSGGQKQRTAIAQMLVRQSPVMIFDDSLSAVDAETDQQIRHALRENTGNATVILISHRIPTLMHADHIFVFEDGRIREQGNHAELMAKKGLYHTIYHLQASGGDEL